MFLTKDSKRSQTNMAYIHYIYVTLVSVLISLITLSFVGHAVSHIRNRRERAHEAGRSAGMDSDGVELSSVRPSGTFHDVSRQLRESNDQLQLCMRKVATGCKFDQVQLDNAISSYGRALRALSNVQSSMRCENVQEHPASTAMD